ncbi:MAG: hypothetical protein ABSE44_14655 [Candidatus Sulfotelmatobacter sp.]|jgi:hypothetical protein
MHISSDASNVSRRQFLAVAGSVAAASTLAAGSDVESGKPSPVPVTAAHYLVTIDVTQNPIKYTGENTDTSTSVSMPNNTLTVNNGDEVKWQAKTSGTHPKYHAGIHFTPNSPFAVSDIKWSENAPGGGVTKNPGSFYYCVGIFDHLNHEIYADDPKIIVGGTPAPALQEAEVELSEIKEKIDSIQKLLKQASKE